MFAPSGWFVIGADNQRVKGVCVGSLDAGLALIGQGAVASVVGRLRADLRVVDVDLAGAKGHATIELLARWCRERGLWHLVRPSGGEDGRAHLFVAPGTVEDELSDTVATLRDQVRAPARAIDLRRSGHVRPLSAPHRHGGTTTPYGNVRDAVRSLRSLRGDDGPSSGSSATTAGDASPAATGRAPLPARPRRRTALPEPWQVYLRTGQAPPHGGHDHSRTTDELLATVAMLRGGCSAEDAWQLIVSAHPEAMTRARVSRKRWISWVWNRAVEDDHARPPAPPARPARLSADVEAAITAARGRLTRLAWTLSPRRRRALLLVGHHVLDRMARTNSRRVPVPERDLVEDTCLTDRKTIRAVLRTLHGPLGTLHTESWDPARRDSSSFEFEIDEAPDKGVCEIPPPSLHTPLPAGIWSQLPGPAHAVWRALLASSTAQDLPTLAHRAALPADSECVTPGDLRAIRSALAALSAAGLASCDARGDWTAQHSAAPELMHRAGQRHQQIVDTVVAERGAYRAGASTKWSLERARAVKMQRLKERAWWEQLPPSERRDHRQRGLVAFDRLALIEQERLKATLAQRRSVRGISEADRHATWLATQQHADDTARWIERKHRYDRLPPQLQHAHAASWARHRERFGVPRAPSAPPAPVDAGTVANPLPCGTRLRDEAFLDLHVRSLDHPDSATA